MFPVILAHGALGPFDEVILIGIAAIFIGMMGLSWWRSRHQAEDDQTNEDNQSPTANVLDPFAYGDPAEKADHFRLD